MSKLKTINNNTTAGNTDLIEACGFELTDEGYGTVWRSVAEGNGEIVCWPEVVDGVLFLAVGSADDGVAYGYIPAAAAVAMVIEGDREQASRVRWYRRREDGAS
jgi:hypothetical protein